MNGKFMKAFAFGLWLIATAFAADDPNESQVRQFKLYVVVHEGLDEGKRANAIAHMSLGLGAQLGREGIRPTPYVSADDVVFHNISEHPFIVMKGKLPALRKLYEDVVSVKDIPHVEFLETMHLGPTFREQIGATREKPLSEITILGMALFGEFNTLKPLLKKFSLLR